ncbi:MAG: type II toxin-antitoxin system Phd/YefM family antitoxin [Caulobacteraceae bacterium]
MSGKTVAATEFKAKCLRLIEEMQHDGEPVTITRRGRPVARLVRIEDPAPKSIIGALKGTVLRYDDPFSPAADPEDWEALR